MNALDIMKYGQGTALGAVEGLAETDWDKPGAGGYWSIKQSLAHLTSYEAAICDMFTELSSGGATPALDRMRNPEDNFNDGEVADRDGMTPEAIVAEFNQHHAEVM